MDPIRMLLADHRQLEAYLETYAWVRPRMARRRHETLAQLQTLLELHLELTEGLLYPSLRGLTRAQGALFSAAEAHALIRFCLDRLAATDDHDPRLDARVHALDLVLRPHLREEEQEIYALARHRLSKKRLEELGEAMLGRRDAILKRPQVTISRGGAPFHAFGPGESDAAPGPDYE